jgi:hypothetical protein
MSSVVVRTFSHEFTVCCPDEETAEGLAFVRAGPAMPARALRPAKLRVERVGAFHKLRTPDGRTIEGTLLHILNRVHRFVNGVLTGEIGAFPLLHAATVLVGGARVILVANKATGKSTLAARLFNDGFTVEGDENIVVFGETVMARPRTLHIKPGTLGLVPGLRDIVLGSPFVTDWDDRPIYSVEPALPGRPWRIEEGRADALVFLEPNHGGRSVMAPIGRQEALQRAIEMSFLPDAGRAQAAVRLRAMVMGSHNFRLVVGDLDNAVWHLQRVTYDLADSYRSSVQRC